MAVQAVTDYINDVLRPQLSKLSPDQKFVERCCAQVELRMHSLLAHWNDEAFRNAVLITVEDEAAFYTPTTAKKEVKEFIGATVRNSLLCILSSRSHCIHAGLGTPLSEKQMQELLSKGIRTWNKYRLGQFADDASAGLSFDYYGDLAMKYPLAWKALSKLGGLRKANERFEPEIPLEPLFLAEEKDEKKNIGFSPFVDEGKINALAATRLIGYTYKIDSFSEFSRNLEALLSGMEYLFGRGGKFVTTNYYVSNGVVQRRIPLREPGHNAEQMEKNMKSTKGLTDLHAAALATRYPF